jgi:RNA recognition motif-containing protein
VVFATPEAAQIAVSAKGTIYVRDRLVDVQMPGEQSTNSYSSEAVVTVFVGALPRGCLDEEFEVAFRQFDPISCLVKRNEMGQSRGFGFVKFATSEMAQMAVAQNGKIIVRDKIVDVKQHGTPSGPSGHPAVGMVVSGGTAAPNQQRLGPDTRGKGNPKPVVHDNEATVFVGALPQDCADEELEVAFREFNPLRCMVKRNESGFARGFGFVKFASPDLAQVAVSANGRILVRDKVVDVKQHGAPAGPTPIPQHAGGSAQPRPMFIPNQTVVGAGQKRPASEAMDEGRRGDDYYKMKYPKPFVDNPGLDPDQQVYKGRMKGRVAGKTGYTFIKSEELSARYNGKDVYLHAKICPWVEFMDLDKDQLVHFQYEEKDGAPVVSRIIRIEEIGAGAREVVAQPQQVVVHQVVNI